MTVGDFHAAIVTKPHAAHWSVGEPVKKPRKASPGQKEMMSLEGKKPAKEQAAKKLASKPQRKSA